MKYFFGLFLFLLGFLGAQAEGFNTELRPDILFFSDHPEKITQSEPLFRGVLPSQTITRVQYYHLNTVPQGMHVSVVLLNHSDRNSNFFYRAVKASRVGHYMEAGQENNRLLLELRSKPWHQKVVSADDFFVVESSELDNDEVISGTLDILSLSGDVEVVVCAHEPGKLKEALSKPLAVAPRDVHTRGVYPVGTFEAECSYVVGDSEQFLTIAATKQPRWTGQDELRGDYGVYYDVTMHLENPTSTAHEVQLMFNPRGGKATATFFLEGEIVLTPVVAARDLYLVKGWRLEPGETLDVRLGTIPEGASSYPIRLVLRGFQVENVSNL